MKTPEETFILIVDDEPSLRQALVFEFKRKGFSVAEAANGKEAIRLVKAKPFDIVISDIRMPDGDGLELLDFLRNENPTIPVLLFITGFSDISPEDAIKRGAHTVLPKPFDRNVLWDTVRKILTKQSK